MTTSPSTYTRITWLAVGLALLTALAYVLIGLNLLGVGDLQVAQDDGAIVYVAAGCYVLGGLLILLRQRWLLAFGVFVNTLVILFFYNMYQARPAVMFSPGGLASKIAQILLEVALLYLVIAKKSK